MNAGAEPEIFEGHGSNPRKRAHRKFVKEDRPVSTVLQIHKWRKYFGRLTDVVALKANDSYCYVLLRQWRRTGPAGRSPWKIFGITPFPC